MEEGIRGEGVKEESLGWVKEEGVGRGAQEEGLGREQTKCWCDKA